MPLCIIQTMSHAVSVKRCFLAQMELFGSWLAVEGIQKTLYRSIGQLLHHVVLFVMIISKNETILNLIFIYCNQTFKICKFQADICWYSNRRLKR